MKTVGRGLKYETSYYDSDTGITHPSSCVTNEGTMIDKRNFATCIMQNDGTYCSNLLNERVNSFSVHDDLIRSSKKWLAKLGPCENYYRKAKEAYIKEMMLKKAKSDEELKKDFDENVQRILILKESDKGGRFYALETCYNFR